MADKEKVCLLIGDKTNTGSNPAKKRGKQKIEITYMDDKTRRKQAFRKRNTGLFKKAHELAVLCGAQVSLKVNQNDEGKSESYQYCSWKPEHENKIPKFTDKYAKNMNKSEVWSPPSSAQQEVDQVEEEEDDDIDFLCDVISKLS